MVVLAMDTATESLAVAVGRAGNTVASACVHVPRGHSRLLQPTAAKLLAGAGIKPSELTAVCVGVGPGSYTGVRMAVSTAKAMATALGVPLYTVSTLAAIASATAVAQSGPVAVLPLLYARRERAFGAVYKRFGENESPPQTGDGFLAAAWRCAVSPQVKPLAAWVDSVRTARAEGRRVLVVHDFASQKPQVQAQLDDVLADFRAQADGLADLRDVASGIGPALLRLAAAGNAQRVIGDAVHGVSPDYALAVEAEVKLAERSDSDGNR